ncbi:cupin domain-containing protein [Celeribacter halophilus]|uniref:cupin domain-containing protein n=1 Tax=Celeribacter halophilus TaxID=576117 RepID=UPI001C08F31B|nr:cupin domain-containing protein [Celeribacter halophilus]MBU2891338.1 DUF861 domain-containing protein [Celeribacter halophilus]MDO6512343.1 cupin domain-containing protein [Celeribacter halophilus]
MKFIKFSEMNPPRIEKDLTGSVVAGSPVQHSQMIYDGHGGAIKSGIWESTAGVFTATMTDFVECCHILEGSAAIKASDGNTYTVEAGDAFVMEAGLRTEWTVETYIKKHFVITSIPKLGPA